MITKEQIEKLNILIGTAMAHGKDCRENGYEDIEVLDLRIEDFLYTLDEDFAKYTIIRHLHKYIGKREFANNMVDTYVKTHNDYGSDIEVQEYINDDNKICYGCTCSTCPEAYDLICRNFGENKEANNCTMCKFGDKKGKGTKSLFKKKCDKKIDAVRCWVAECNDTGL